MRTKDPTFLHVCVLSRKASHAENKGSSLTASLQIQAEREKGGGKEGDAIPSHLDVFFFFFFLSIAQ